jgi:N-dimethylarginine dimethylaminohydrolase
MDYGVTSMSAPLRRVAVRAPAPASDFAQAHWAQPLDVDLLIDQHAAFAGILQRLGCDVLELPPLEGLPDSCFTYDPAFTIGDGVIALRSAKAVRVGEGERLAADLAAAGIPTVASLSGSATADGGDMFWLDDDTLAVGRSYRTNAVAVAQLSEILRPEVCASRCTTYPMTRGPSGACT